MIDKEKDRARHTAYVHKMRKTRREYTARGGVYRMCGTMPLSMLEDPEILQYLELAHIAIDLCGPNGLLGSPIAEWA